MTDTQLMCPCGCGELAKPGRLYANPDRCKYRVYRAKKKARAVAAGLPASLSLKSIEAANTTSRGGGHRETRRNRASRPPRPGVTVYIPDPSAAEEARSLLTRYSGPLQLVGEAIGQALERRRRRMEKSGRGAPAAARPGRTDRRASAGTVEQPSARGGDTTTGAALPLEVSACLA